MIRTTCCIAGGGPAGLMLGWLLARAGIEVMVLEKHSDFLRDFRGDTIHPSTLENLREAGLLDDFLCRPHQKVAQMRAIMGDEEVLLADFTHLSTTCRFMVLMPQWDFLNFLSQQASRHPNFQLCLNSEVIGLLEEGKSVAGVRVKIRNEEQEIRAPLVVGCDGRSSTVRTLAGLDVESIGAPVDVLWLRIPKSKSQNSTTFRFKRGRVLVLLDRDDYWQCGYTILKGGFEEVRSRGIESLRKEIIEMAPALSESIGAVQTWDDVRLLNVRVDRLREWCKPGLLCIGDAAHAMSPVGGVGINLAIQDAVAAANILVEPLRRGGVSLSDLQKVQRRREFPARVTQRIQGLIQKLTVRNTRDVMPLPMRLVERTGIPSRLRARVMGIGVRPEHIAFSER